MLDRTKAQIQNNNTRDFQKKKYYPELAQRFISKLTAASVQLGGFRRTSATEPLLNRHVDLLSNPYLSQSANTIRRECIVNQLQHCYGNAYVQQVINMVHDRKRNAMNIGKPYNKYEQKSKIAIKKIQKISYMETAFGLGFSTLRVFQNAYVFRFNSRALNFGKDIHFVPGKYDLKNTKGQTPLRPDLAHVIQQRTGKVPTDRAPTVLTDLALEQEAKKRGDQTAQGRPITNHETPAGGPLRSFGGNRARPHRIQLYGPGSRRTRHQRKTQKAYLWDLRRVRPPVSADFIRLTEQYRHIRRYFKKATDKVAIRACRLMLIVIRKGYDVKAPAFWGYIHRAQTLLAKEKFEAHARRAKQARSFYTVASTATHKPYGKASAEMSLSKSERRWIQEVFMLPEISQLFTSFKKLPPVVLHRVKRIATSGAEGETDSTRGKVAISSIAYTAKRSSKLYSTNEGKFKGVLIHEILHYVHSKTKNLKNMVTPKTLMRIIVAPKNASEARHKYGWFVHPKTNFILHFDELPKLGLSASGAVSLVGTIPGKIYGRKTKSGIQLWESSPMPMSGTLISPEEDIAETVSLYLTNSATKRHLKNKYPQRYKLMQFYFTKALPQAAKKRGQFGSSWGK